MSLVKNPRYRTFLENYSRTFDLIGSFIAAGLRVKRSGDEVEEAAELLQIPEHVEYLKLLVGDREQSGIAEVTGDRVLEELSKIAFSTIVDACELTPNGVILKSPSDIPAHKIAAIQSVTTHSDAAGNRNIAVKMHDKLGALKVLAKHTNVDVDINSLIARIRSYGYEVVDTTVIGEDAIETEE